MTPSQRSVLFVPGANAKALSKAPSLNADAIIIDLEDAVSPAQKQMARTATLITITQPKWQAGKKAVRVNALHSQWGNGDVLAFAPEMLDALVIPKVESAAMLRDVRRLMAKARLVPGRPAPALWAMIETPRGILNLEDIAANATELGLNCLIIGTNDLAKALRCDGVSNNREALAAHLSRVVLIARQYGLTALDGVYNAFDDAPGFAREAKQGRRFGFDGKSLIHPSQIDAANQVFGPSAAQISRAKAIVRAFALKKNAGKGVINLDGEMIERLHWHSAQTLLDSLPAKGAKPAPRARKKTS